MADLTHYRLLSGLLEYPEAGYPQTVTEIYKLVDGKYPAAAAALERFIELLPADNLLTMQELFTRSFDVQAIATLDIGYVLFGDDYKRGELLANLNSGASQGEQRLRDGTGGLPAEYPAPDEYLAG